MHGLQKSRRSNKVSRQFFVLLVAFIVVLWGCSSSEEAGKNDGPEMTEKEFLAKYEKTFNPADYDVDISVINAEEKRRMAELEGPAILTTAAPETVSGFRVQIFLTQEIDQANQLKDSAAAQVPEEWVYVVYDAPYYKVRIGNFPDRQSANVMVKKLAETGFKDAWVVPDNVFKNPPPKPPEIFIEPEKPLDQHR